jgi:[amino group carrier protein]-lysine/ornithine hydrolase
MTDSEAIALLRELVGTPSHSGEEAAAVRVLCERLSAAGFRARVDDAGNAVAEIGGAGPLVLLLGHIDTVPGAVPVREAAGILHGRGAVDAKGSLSAMAAAAARSSHLPVRLMLVGAVEEELPSSRGARFLLDRLTPDAVVIGEPSGWDGVVIGYKGRYGFTCEVAAEAVHSSREEPGAVEQAVEFWDCLRLAVAEDRAPPRSFDRLALRLRSLNGDMEHARAHVVCRTPVGFDVGRLRAEVERLASGAVLTFEGHDPAVLVDRSNPAARSLAASIRECGATPRVKVKSGTSDMNVVAQRWRVPMAAYGPGDSSLDHTAHEHIDLDEFRRSVGVLSLALGRLAAVLAPAPDEPAEEALSEEDEAILNERLRALGYLD